MWAKILAQLIKELVLFLPVLAHKAYLAFKEYQDKKKRIKDAHEAAKRVEDARTSNDVRGSVDSLP